MAGRTIGLVVAAVLLATVALDQVAEARVQDAVATEVGERLGTEVQVDVSGSPLLLFDLVRSRISRVEIVASGFAVGDPPVEVANLTLDLVDVRISIPGVIGGSASSLTVGEGLLTAHLSQAEVQRLLEAEGVPWQIDIRDGVLRATGEFQGEQVVVTADAIVDAAALVLLARDVDPGVLGPQAVAAIAETFATRIALPELPLGLQLTSVAIGDGRVVLSGPVPSTLGLD